MSSKHAFLLPLLFLQACTSAAKSPEPATGSPPPREAVRAAPPAPAATTAPGLVKTFRAALPICFDAALKVCRDRDYAVKSQQRTGSESATIAVQSASLEFTLSFTRAPDNRTRVTLVARGDAREEPSRILDVLGQALLEPRD